MILSDSEFIFQVALHQLRQTQQHRFHKPMAAWTSKLIQAVKVSI
jgi:hypothetical protein